MLNALTEALRVLSKKGDSETSNKLDAMRARREG